MTSQIVIFKIYVDGIPEIKKKISYRLKKKNNKKKT